MQNFSFSILKVRRLRLNVHLGCTAEEQKNLQPVDVNLTFKFEGLPTGSVSDELEETLCYDKISTLLKNKVENKYFKLVEKLAFELFAEVRNFATPNIKLWIEVIKVHPPVEDLLGGVSFSFGEFSNENSYADL